MEADEPMTGFVESRLLDDGGLNWTLTTKVPMHDADGGVIGLVGITREINELKQTELNLQHLATHDVLSGLPNRFLMMDRLSQTLARAARQRSSFVVLFIDIDAFKRSTTGSGTTSAIRRCAWSLTAFRRGYGRTIRSPVPTETNSS